MGWLVRVFLNICSHGVEYLARNGFWLSVFVTLPLINDRLPKPTTPAGLTDEELFQLLVRLLAAPEDVRHLRARKNYRATRFQGSSL